MTRTTFKQTKDNRPGINTHRRRGKPPITKLHLTKEARDLLQQLCGASGMSKGQVVARALEVLAGHLDAIAEAAAQQEEG